MKKIIFGIFAHPDDEAFGPAGTLLRETRTGTDLHLITLTAGDAGNNPNNAPDLGALRLNEWYEAGKRLGATSMQFLGYKDGTLCNKDMITASQKIIETITPILQNVSEDTSIEFMTLDLNGYTGHIDHIIASRAASYVFYTFKKTDARFTRIRYACLPRKLFPTENTDWIFMDAGRPPHEIDETIDARSLRTDIIHVMQAHQSQRSDYDYNLTKQGDDLGLNYFIVRP